ncbi:uncharacterized protein LOC111081348 isoform X2 [Drosophila obscura]|uniref:uncharacterized protein LOC111081348 isoform X2 n=1 Tax=Drosophila obscura TaxID=7282 RepID=UPI001BB2A6EA|nr:uncharacterized protein LOC111081348 isoform X2 [Drosophila obscura]
MAWILITIGLCIIMTASLIYSPVYNDNTRKDRLDESEEIFEFLSKEQRKASDNISSTTMIGCTEVSCRIACSNNENLYKDMSAIMNTSSCEIITSIIISNQFRYSLENKWTYKDVDVLDIILSNSHLTEIKSASFNIPLFAKVFQMSWINLKLQKLDSGALLGLYSLKKLEIDSKLPAVSMAFLQPVQTTLTHLKLNVHFIFYSNLSLFENIYLEKVTYLDLSYNRFLGSLNKRIFMAVPNTTYLYLQHCSITAIEENAFNDIAHNLKIVNLAYNMLSTISYTVLTGINPIYIELEPNNWLCNCELLSLINYVSKNSRLFINVPYCRLPYNFFGIHFNDLDNSEINCSSPNDLVITTQKTYFSTTTAEKSNQTSAGWQDEFSTPTTIESGKYTGSYTNEYAYGPILQFSCSQAIDLNESVHLSYDAQREINTDKVEQNQSNYANGVFVFQPPTYDLYLELSDDLSVQVRIDNYYAADQLNIIWFTELFDGSTDVFDVNYSYNCVQYSDNVVISPLFCQPLYVPMVGEKTLSATDSVQNSNKQFSVGMLCLIFFVSTIFGATIAYLGIKVYPDLLEGSKNVLIIKKLDKTCYISTITESEYTLDARKIKYFGAQLGNDTRHPYSEEIDVDTRSVLGSVYKVDEYEMPKELDCSIKEYSDLSYESTVAIPPPLPKRNSNNLLLN